MNGVQTRFKCKLDVKRCKRFVFPPSSLLPRSNALKTKAIRYFQTDQTLTRIVSSPLDEKAFTTLYRLYWSKVYNFSRLYLSSITEVEEVVQEVFVKVWETRDFLRADDNFKGYLFIITRNLIFNQFRKSFNENAYKLTVLSAAMDYYDMEDELSAADLKEFIKRMVGGLPPRQQEVFKMSRDEHLTYKEIATRLNISEKTVERHINEAIKFLKKNIMLYLIFIF